MKKIYLRILLCFMGIAFASLLIVQVRYTEQILQLHFAHFDKVVAGSLSNVVSKVNENEVATYIEKVFNEQLDTETVAYILGETDEMQRMETSLHKLSSKCYMPDVLPMGTDNRSLSKVHEAHSERYRQFISQSKDIVNKVIAKMLNDAPLLPIAERVNFAALGESLQTELVNHDINLAFVYTVTEKNGKVVYRSTADKQAYVGKCFRQQLFPADPEGRVYFLDVWFPEREHYNMSQSFRMMMPLLLLTILIFITFVFVIVYIFRQKRLSEIKTDFVNNMTHELKTPISSISLAGQMLSDTAVNSNPKILAQVSRVITDETKRLSFLVERVLQMSVFENGHADMEFQEIDVNELLTTIIGNFSLKVSSTNGKIISQLKAAQATVLADEMHLTNVFYNLMDNAVKYRKGTLILTVSTENNDKGHLLISIEDNGIGIAKDHLKNIFDKFYRVPTGNVHNVKGFGLGLAYVARIVKLHHGTVRAESAVNIGTKFVIELPTVKM
ncbi:MAG: sensor histidine kinase [Paludibacteraceae bacterium]